MFGWDQRPGVSLVAGLSSALASGRRDRRSPLELDGGRISGGRLGRIGGIEVEPHLQLGDRFLQLGDPSLQRAEDLQKGGLSLGRDGVPERFSDWRVRAHTVDTTQLLYKVFDPVNGYLLGDDLNVGMRFEAHGNRGVTGPRDRRRMPRRLYGRRANVNILICRSGTNRPFVMRRIARTCTRPRRSFHRPPHP